MLCCSLNCSQSESEKLSASRAEMGHASGCECGQEDWLKTGAECGTCSTLINCTGLGNVGDAL